MAEAEWWSTFFDEDYLPFHRDRPHRDTEQELQLLERVLGDPAGKRLLDACCGPGRHAIPLARRGWRVTGVDQSTVMLDQARAAAAKDATPFPLEWVQADLRYPFAQACFDAAICMFTSFGYCAEDAENCRLLETIHQALNPGGRFVLDVANRDFLVQHPDAIRNWWRRGEDFILEETTFNPVTSIAHTRNVLLTPEGVRESEYHIRLYSLHELVGMMVDVGFEVTGAHGDFPDSPIALASPRIILISDRLPE